MSNNHTAVALACVGVLKHVQNTTSRTTIIKTDLLHDIVIAFLQLYNAEEENTTMQ